MRVGGGHAKGAEFERQIATHLSLWASRGERKDIFWRTPASGARSRVTKGNKSHEGDIMATDPIGEKFTANVLLELKAYAHVDWCKLLFGEVSEFTAFWHKLQADALTSDKLPVLVVKENRRPVLCLSQWMPAGITTHAISSRFLAPVRSQAVYLWPFAYLLTRNYDWVCNEISHHVRPTFNR